MSWPQTYFEDILRPENVSAGNVFCFIFLGLISVLVYCHAPLSPVCTYVYASFASLLVLDFVLTTLYLVASNKLDWIYWVYRHAESVLKILSTISGGGVIP